MSDDNNEEDGNVRRKMKKVTTTTICQIEGETVKRLEHDAPKYQNKLQIA